MVRVTTLKKYQKNNEIVFNLDTPVFVNRVDISSAKEMADVVLNKSADQDIIIKAAAVADYRPKEVAANKIKKADDSLTIELERTTDILKTLGQNKKAGQFICGFSMETENMIEHTKEKLAKKNVDLMIANNLKTEGAGFGTDTNVVTLISKDFVKELPKMSKDDVADAILDEITEMLLS